MTEDSLISEAASDAWVDVLLPTRAPAPWLGETLDGLLVQTHHNWRLVAVVHGDPSELTRLILDRVPNAVIVPMTQDAKLQDLLNAGLKSCTADYVARQDHDDVPEPTRLAEQVAFLQEHPKVLAVGSAATEIDEHGNEIGLREIPSGPGVLKGLRWRSMLIHPSVMFRRAAVLEVGGYDVGASNAEDYELWLRLAAVGELDNVSEPLLRYRVHAQQMSQARAIPRATRALVGKSRRALAHSRRESVIMAQLRQIAWSAPQIVRSIRRPT
ncbi:MAG: glycosyltransferase [Actinomycetota bacterium]|nr:glycosyltransferase [Actinomycetota bacterium]MDP2287461.1 glycosyltransferase [Actinomycetota bacterium]